METTTNKENEMNSAITIEDLRTRHYIGIEADCRKCGCTFNPSDLHDESSGGDYIGDDNYGPTFRHYQDEDENECGGVGILAGAWK